MQATLCDACGQAVALNQAAKLTLPATFDAGEVTLDLHRSCVTDAVEGLELLLEVHGQRWPGLEDGERFALVDYAVRGAIRDAGRNTTAVAGDPTLAQALAAAWKLTGAEAADRLRGELRKDGAGRG